MKIFNFFLKLEGIAIVLIHFVGQCSSIVNAKFIDCKTSYPSDTLCNHNSPHQNCGHNYGCLLMDYVNQKNCKLIN